MDDRKIRVAITHGDTNGIGYELIFKTFSEPEILELCTPIIYGSPKVAAYHRNALNLQTNFSIINSAEEAKDGRVNLLTVFDEEIKVEMGTATTEAAEAERKAVEKAMEDYPNKAFDVLVTAPSHQKTIHHQKALTMLVNEKLRVALLTEKMPLNEVASHITSELIKEKATISFTTLKRDFNISNPRIAILALNPKDNEGKFGKEEKELIIPAINELEENKVYAYGPYVADEFFAGNLYDTFDAVLAMYYEQGVTPFRALSPEGGVIYTAGTDIILTTSDNGVDYEHAGKGVADESLFRQAIYTAIDAFRNRTEYDIPFANPLKKFYHEKRDDSEKVRFAVSKKQENKEAKIEDSNAKNA